MPLDSDALAAEIGERISAPVQMMQLRHGIFDEASISLIASATVDEIGRLSETRADTRRFRPNLLIRSTREVPFEEDEWVGGILSFGESDDAAALAVTMRDLRCPMVNIDPDDASLSPKSCKPASTRNQNHAGVYCTVTRTGTLAVGQRVLFHR